MELIKNIVAQIGATLVATLIISGGGVTWLITWFIKRKSKYSEVQIGPIQVFLPQWVGETDDDFYQDGVTQMEGFAQGESEARVIHQPLKVDYNPMYENSSGAQLLQCMQKLYEERHSMYFIMTMSSKVEEISAGFKAWHNQCVSANKAPPVLIATVASAPELADVKNGIVRWYIRSDEESRDLANKLDKLGFASAAAFCITRTPGMCDDRYGKEGFQKFCEYFDGKVLPGFCFYVTAKTVKAHVKNFLDKIPETEKCGVFVIGYGDMVKNTLTELITGGYNGCIVCTSTLTDPHWQPPANVLVMAQAQSTQIFTVLPAPIDHWVGKNRNVVFLFARKTLMRVLKLTAGQTKTQAFLNKWLEKDPEETLKQTPQIDGDIEVKVRIVDIEHLR